MTNDNPGLFASKKQAIEIIAGEETYKNLSTFESVHELNETVRHYKQVLADKLNKTQLAVLELLHNYSANEGKKNGVHSVGVSWLRKNKIAETLGKSRRTIIRVCKHLEALGIIRQYEMKRESDMYQTSNAIVIQPLPEENEFEKTQNVTQEPIENQRKMSHQKNNCFSLKQNIKTYKERKAVSYDSNYLNLSNTPKQINKKAVQESNFIPHWIPKTFSKFVSNFYSDSKTIKEFWIVVKQCNRVIDCISGDRAFNKEQEIHIAITAFKEFVTKIKSGVYMKKGIFAYFNGIVNKIMGNLYFDEDFMSNSRVLED